MGFWSWVRIYYIYFIYILYGRNIIWVKVIFKLFIWVYCFMLGFFGWVMGLSVDLIDVYCFEECFIGDDILVFVVVYV